MTNSLFVRKAWAALEQAKVNRNNADAALEEAYTVWCEAKVMEAMVALAPSVRRIAYAATDPDLRPPAAK